MKIENKNLYQKRPVVVEAFRFYYEPGEVIENHNLSKFPLWFQQALEKTGSELGRVFLHSNGLYVISTLDGFIEISFGDYIILGTEKEIYSCKSAAFSKTYNVFYSDLQEVPNTSYEGWVD